MSLQTAYYIGVDVGTSSVRACVVDGDGFIKASNTKEIKIWNPRTNFYQQSSDDIWDGVVHTVKKCLFDCQIAPDNIKGIGFDATCSMVVLDENMSPLTISYGGDNNENVILWMDHRAKAEVEVINATGHRVLDSVGGIMSLEMQPPKLMWLKKHLPDTWKKAHHFFDLPDYLTWRATGSLSRGMCSAVCKWSFIAESETKMGWDESFFNLVGLGDLAQDGFCKLGRKVLTPGAPVGTGLTAECAAQLGLPEGTPVGASLIDAHAGALGCLGCSPSSFKDLPNLENRLVLIAGTSSCHIIASEKKIPVSGVWGPFLSVVVPGMWVNEGGQSSTGSLLDFITSTHSAYPQVKKKAEERGVHVYDYLNQYVLTMAEKLETPVAYLTQNLHMWPDFHGNRSPVADPNLSGMICGLRLSGTEDDLALVYLATVQALGYGTKHIISEMEKSGHQISVVYLCGGLRKNELYVQTHADVLDLPIILPDTEESVLLGAAMLGAHAAGERGTLRDVMSAMGGEGVCLQPDKSVAGYHEKKYKVFLKMLQDQMKYRQMMQS